LSTVISDWRPEKVGRTKIDFNIDFAHLIKKVKYLFKSLVVCWPSQGDLNLIQIKLTGTNLKLFIAQFHKDGLLAQLLELYN